MANNNKILLRVRNREKIIFEGQVKSLSSVNKVGKFDVLARHANFISLVQESLVIRKANGQKQTVAIDNGVLRVSKNQAEVYLGIK
jgi:F0F1-type ATP synthase epsilon subunit